MSPRPPSLTALPTYLAHHASVLGYQPYVGILAAHGITLAHVSILYAVDDFGPLSQQQLADSVRAHKSHLVPRIDRLEERGLARRTRDPDDRRRHLIVLTDTGRALLRELEPAVAAAQDTFLAPLAPRERTAFVDMLGRVLAAYDADAGR